MMFQEEAIILPVLLSIFHDSDWLRIAKESAAFGYAIIEPDEEWIPKSQKGTFVEDENQAINNTENVAPTHENIAFGGGYLTTEEANLILNNLPLEITFVRSEERRVGREWISLISTMDIKRKDK